MSVHLRLSAKQYDQSQREAAAARLTLADWLRRAVAEACQKRRG